MNVSNLSLRRIFEKITINTSNKLKNNLYRNYINIEFMSSTIYTNIKIITNANESKDI